MQYLYRSGTNALRAGASFLNSNALISVEEGLQYGLTTEFVHLGDYNLTDYQTNGYFNQTLNINGIDKVSAMRRVNSFYPRNFATHHKYYDTFESSTLLSGNYSQRAGTWDLYSGAFTALHTVHNNASADSYIDYTANTNIRNVRIITRGQFSASGTYLQVVFRRQTSDPSTFYRALVFGNQYVIQRYVSGSGTTVSSGTMGFTLAINTMYWLMVIAYENRILFMISTDGVTYTTLTDTTDTTIRTGGAVGLGTFNASITETYYDFLDITEIGNAYTTEDILKSSLSLADINDVIFDSYAKGFTNFDASSGSSWVLGTSSNIFNIANGGGNSWNTYILQGTSLSDFCAEIEMRGSSANAYGGILVGTSNNFYGNYYWLGLGLSQYGNEVESYIGSRTTYASRSQFAFPKNNWVKLRLIKNGTFIGWYANGSLINSFYGTSLMDLDNVSFGLLTYRGNALGSTIEFRNFRIQKLGTLVENAVYQATEPVSSLFERYLPDDTAYMFSGQTLEIFTIGTSRYTYNYLDFTFVNDSQDGIEKTDLYNHDDMHVFEGQRKLSYTRSSVLNTFENRIDKTFVRFNKDESITSYTRIQDAAYGTLYQNNKYTNLYSFRANVRPTIQLFDFSGIINTELNIAGTGLIHSFTKSYDAKSGSFDMTLDLGRGIQYV